MIDLTQADSVEVSISQDRSGIKVWVNVNGQCLLRAYRVKEFYYDGMAVQDRVLGPMKEDKPSLCPICQQPQFDTPSGLTCNNGHGGE